MRKLIHLFLVSTPLVGLVQINVPAVTAAAPLYFSPNLGSYAKNSTLTTTLLVNSGADPINAVGVVISYPTAKLRLLEVALKQTFEISISSSNTTGKIDLARATETPKTGEQQVATLSFKVLVDSGTASLTFDSSEVYRSTDSVNISAGGLGATFNLTSASTPTPTSSPPAGAPAPPTFSAPSGASSPPASSSAPASAPTPVEKAGLLGTYFKNKNLTEKVLSRGDSTVNFNWKKGSPDKSVSVDNFSVRWEGKIFIPKTNTYTFYAKSDDGVRVWVDNKRIINNWRNQGAVERIGKIKLDGNKKYDIKIEYYENKNNAVMELRWAAKGLKKQIIPQDKLSYKQ